MSTYRVVLTDQVFPDVACERQLLEEVGAELVVAEGEREDVLTLAADADALLDTYFALDAQALREISGRCRIVARYGIGVDNIDLKAARELGIVVTNVPDYCIEEVATHTVALLLSLLRRLPEGNTLVRRGGWGIDSLRPIHRSSSRTVGLVGYGRIGARVAELLRPFGFSILVADPYVRQVEGAELLPLEDLLQRAHAVSLHTPLTDETRGLIGPRALRLMSPEAVLINTSRGPLVQLGPLVEALQAGKLAGAALDVFEQEPPPLDMVESVPGLIMTPHAAFYSEEAIAESQAKAARQIVRVLSGHEPDYRVN